VSLRSVPDPRLLVAVFVLVASLSRLEAPASALYPSAGTGPASAAVGTLQPPAPPAISGSGITGLTCNANVTWPAPPTGVAYRVLRRIGTVTVIVTGPLTGTGILSDSVPVASLDGSLSYALRAEWLANPAWVATGTAATVTNC
jgi:hypothetical protein